MKKTLCFIVVLALLFGGCSLQEERWDYRPMIFFNDAFYGETHIVISAVPEGWTKTDEVTKQVPSHEPPLKENGTSNSLYAGTPIYTNPESPELIYAELEGEKFIAYVFIEETRISGTSDDTDGDITTVPLVNIGGTRWIASGTEPAPEPPEGCIIGTIEAYSNYSYKHGQTNILGCVGQPYALVEGVYYVYCSRHPFQNESLEFYYGPGWLECHTVFGNPHSSISSSTILESEPVFVPKGVVGTDYVIWENLDFEEGVFGTEDDLEKWKAAVKNTDGITKITVQHVECENRYLSEEEVLILLSELQSIFPSVYEEFENPATGGSYSVAAYGENGEMVWAMSHGGYFTVYLPEYENLLYFNGNDIYFDSLAEICSYRTPMSSP